MAIEAPVHAITLESTIRAHVLAVFRRAVAASITAVRRLRRTVGFGGDAAPRAAFERRLSAATELLTVCAGRPRLVAPNPRAGTLVEQARRAGVRLRGAGTARSGSRCASCRSSGHGSSFAAGTSVTSVTTEPHFVGAREHDTTHRPTSKQDSRSHRSSPSFHSLHGRAVANGSRPSTIGSERAFRHASHAGRVWTVRTLGEQRFG